MTIGNKHEIKQQRVLSLDVLVAVFISGWKHEVWYWRTYMYH